MTFLAKIYKYVLFIAVIGILIYIFLDTESIKWHYLKNVNGLIIFLSLSLVYSYLSGLQQFIILKKQNVRLSLQDQLLLPMSMSLFGYIIPTNGGLIFSIYFFKKKYNITPINSISIGVVLIYISFFISGIIGILYCMLYPSNVFVLLPFSILLIIFPFLVKTSINILIQLNKGGVVFINKIIEGLNKIVLNTSISYDDKRVFAKIITINLMMIIVNIMSIYYLIKMLNLEVPLLSVVLIVLFLRISSLIRILPGNFGIDELMAGGIFAFLGLTASDGVLIFLYSRIISLVFLIIPLGVFHIFLNNKILALSRLKNIKGQLKH